VRQAKAGSRTAIAKPPKATTDARASRSRGLQSTGRFAPAGAGCHPRIVDDDDGFACESSAPRGHQWRRCEHSSTPAAMSSIPGSLTEGRTRAKDPDVAFSDPLEAARVGARGGGRARLSWRSRVLYWRRSIDHQACNQRGIAVFNDPHRQQPIGGGAGRLGEITCWSGACSP